MNAKSWVLIIGAILGSTGLSQWYVQHQEAAKELKYLIVTTDDAGWCPAVNEATIKALEFGLVKSTSIMVVCPGFDEFAAFATSHPEYDYGVHLTLTSDNSDFSWGPILGSSVPSLIRADGNFWRHASEVAEHADIDDVTRELEAQIRRALDRGIRITHLDHHMWVLLQRPDLFEVFVKLGLEFNIPIRAHREFNSDESGPRLQNPDDYHRIIQPLTARHDYLFDSIEANNYLISPDNKESYFLNAVRGLQPGVSEFVIHCSVNRPDMKRPPAVERREADFAVFTSQRMRDEIQKLGIRIIDWKELAELRKQGTI